MPMPCEMLCQHGISHHSQPKLSQGDYMIHDLKKFIVFVSLMPLIEVSQTQPIALLLYAVFLTCSVLLLQIIQSFSREVQTS